MEYPIAEDSKREVAEANKMEIVRTLILMLKWYELQDDILPLTVACERGQYIRYSCASK